MISEGVSDIEEEVCFAIEIGFGDLFNEGEVISLGGDSGVSREVLFVVEIGFRDLFDEGEVMNSGDISGVSREVCFAVAKYLDIPRETQITINAVQADSFCI